MAETIILYQKCSQCNGTSTFQPAHGPNGQSMPCNWPGCENGYINYGTFTLNPSLTDLMDKNDITHDKCDIIQGKCDDIQNKCGDLEDKCDQIINLLTP